MHYLKNILSVVFLLSLLSCDRIKSKGDRIIDKTKETVSDTKRKIGDKKDQLVDKVFPGYDSGTPDTESNKKRFKEHLEVDLTSDVKDIYAYGDFMGIDYKVVIAFTCDQTTIDKIISTKNMQKTSKGDRGLVFLDEFKWWDKTKTAHIAPYKAGKEYEYWEYLWYDAETRKAYYEEFSL